MGRHGKHAYNPAVCLAAVQVRCLFWRACCVTLQHGREQLLPALHHCAQQVCSWVGIPAHKVLASTESIELKLAMQVD